jgi:hypothetical protein
MSGKVAIYVILMKMEKFVRVFLVDVKREVLKEKKREGKSLLFFVVKKEKEEFFVAFQNSCDSVFFAFQNLCDSGFFLLL